MTFCCLLSSGDYNGHRTFEDQLACLSDQNMFESDIKDWSKDIGRCTSHCLYMSPTVFMYPIKTLHLLLGDITWYQPKEESLSHRMWFILLFVGIMSDQNTTMLAQPPHLSDICQITHQQLLSPLLSIFRCHSFYSRLPILFEGGNYVLKVQCLNVVYIPTYVHTYLRTHTHTHAHTYTHTHTRTYIHTYIKLILLQFY